MNLQDWLLLNMEKVISTGLLAYGMSGKIFHGPFLENHPGFKLRAVTERSAKNAEKDYPGIISYSSVDQLLNDPEIELVVINTPNNTHYEYAEKALNAGTYTNTWTVKDDCGNTSDTFTQVITLQDTAAPTFIGDLPSAVGWIPSP